MEIEDLEIRDFLATVPPLDELDDITLDKVTRSIQITYARRGARILESGQHNDQVILIRTGAVEVCDASGTLCAHFDAGEWVGYRSVMRGGRVEKSATATEDSLLYLVPADCFLSLMKEHKHFHDYFAERRNRRIRNAAKSLQKRTSAILISSSVKDLIHGDPPVIDAVATIRRAARSMKEQGVTAMVVTEGERIRGILTDRAFCTRVAAVDLPLDRPVAEIMTPDPVTISDKATGPEALLLMARHNIRHLPVVSKGRLVGLLTAADLIRHQSNNPIYLVNEIHRAGTVEELEALSGHLPDTLVHLVESSLTAYDIGHAISSVGRAINQRLVALAEEELGPPPVPYAWIIAGSPARNEQTARSDQDNALLLDNTYDEQEHGGYFEKMATFVCDGLHRCGYVYCPGDVMATNPKWRQPLAVWRGYFRNWIDTPRPKALMYASIFFDLRCCSGTGSLLDTLQQRVLERTKGNTFFLAYLASNALHYQPPLGIFRNFVLEKSGKEEKALNLKKRGVVPIIDMARVFALSAGIRHINTQDRLEAAYETGVLSRQGMLDLRDAFEFISTVRLQHQAQQIKRGLEPDNHVPPEQLSSLERHHMKDAFEVVRTMQSAMQQKYHSENLR